jgi:hypothetical protein
MSEEHCVSRRASLKSLGAVGAALVLGGAGAAARQGDPKPAAGNQDKPTVNVVDLAASRFTKGHS